jgi:dihydroflavonol-4-reductase
MTEADWLDDAPVPYLRAKTQAERRAWQLSEELGVPLVTVLPGGIGGPGFARRTPTIDLLEGMMLGTLRFGAPHANFTYVDARDVARGHILAAEREVTGRFILCDQQPSFAEFTRIMHEIDPEVPVAPWVLPGFLLGSLPFFDAMNAKLLGSQRFVTRDGVAAIRGRVYNVSSARAKGELNWEPAFPLRESLRDTMVAIRALRRSEGKHRMA